LAERRGNATTGFELPGAADRRQISRLKAEIHHLDKPHMHLQLADIYFSQGKLEERRRVTARRMSGPKDEDIRAIWAIAWHGATRRRRALPLLEGVFAQNPKHDYGYTSMTLAETLAATGQIDWAIATWRQVLALYSYPRARCSSRSC